MKVQRGSLLVSTQSTFIWDKPVTPRTSEAAIVVAHVKDGEVLNQLRPMVSQKVKFNLKTLLEKH